MPKSLLTVATATGNARWRFSARSTVEAARSSMVYLEGVIEFIAPEDAHRRMNNRPA